MAVAEISVVPVGTSTASISDYVATAVKIAKESGLKYELSSMATNLEGDVGSILEVFRKMHEGAFEQGAVRVLTSLKIFSELSEPILRSNLCMTALWAEANLSLPSASKPIALSHNELGKTDSSRTSHSPVSTCSRAEI